MAGYNKTILVVTDTTPTDVPLVGELEYTFESVLTVDGSYFFPWLIEIVKINI